MTKSEIRIEELEKQGWTFDHRAVCDKHQPAGSVSPMVSRKGFEFCRVHEGGVRRVMRFGKHHTYQMTVVMRRPINQ